MELKVRWLQINAGKSIVFIHIDDAKKLNVHPSDRVHLKSKRTVQTAVVDVAKEFLKKGEVAISEDLAKRLELKRGDSLNVLSNSSSEGRKVLQNGLFCKKYTKPELKKIIGDIVNNELTEAEIAYFIAGVNYCGMSLDEIYFLIQAIVETGKVLTWSTPLVADKHSIGGIPGNRTTPIVVSICAAAGVIMPKTSSRAITSAAGTADTMEVLTRVDLSTDELKKVVKKTGACLAWGGSLGLAPADDKLIQVEKILNIDPEPQLLASILAKKVSVGSKYVLIDIPYGPGSKVSRAEGRKLEIKFKKLAKLLGIKLEVVLTKGDQPIGQGIGPTLEMMDVLKVLRRESDAPKDLERKALFIAGKLLELVGKAPKSKGKKLAETILNDKRAFKKFKEIIEAQKGKIKELAPAKHRAVVRSTKSGKIKEIHNKQINSLAHILGCPHDKSAGISLHKHLGESVSRDEPLMTLYSESPFKLQEALSSYKENYPIRVG
jgi:putative thymidine phosphorylase